jgi:hypothetical protein
MAGGLSERRTRQSPHVCFDMDSSRCELAHLPKVYEQRDHDEGHRRSYPHCKLQVEVEGQVAVESSFTAGWLMATRVPASEILSASHAWVNRADAAELKGSQHTSTPAACATTRGTTASMVLEGPFLLHFFTIIFGGQRTHRQAVLGGEPNVCT